MVRFSVCMSVYHGDNALFFKDAINSIYNQNRRPDEIILVVDGPVSDDLSRIICEYENSDDSFIVIRLSKNSGHAIARQTAIDAAHYPYIAIMDSDDFAVPKRFEKQVSFLEKHPEVDVLGGQIEEFIGELSNVVSSRIVPQTDSEIKDFLKKRCPMNFMTVMMKQEAVKKVRGIIDWYCEEDYFLWVRMTEHGMTFANLPDNLVNVRVGKEMYQRRGGVRYFRSEARLQYYMIKHGIISLPRYLYNVFIRFVVQVAMPNKIRGWVFRTFARK